MTSLLVVEDDLVLRETLEYNLRKQGYEVRTAVDGRTAVDLARQEQPDLIVLDVMLPGMDGFEVCRILRQEMNVPILMLTARNDEMDKVVGLEVGADDYLTKPFGMRELLARIKAQLRRVRLIREEFVHATEDESQRIEHYGDEFGGPILVIDRERREALRDGEPLHLKPKEYELLIYLIDHRGRSLSRDQILEDVWGWDFSGGSRTVDVHVRWLREKIETTPGNPTRIVTVHGMGYRFEG